ncbi:response regulator [Kaistia sp. UC242_56]|uniref:CheY-like chemotaxis protein n=2 Tax=Kaistia defluvii TaxID=410841 RepID=A0ABV2R0B5_9HYPH
MASAQKPVAAVLVVEDEPLIRMSAVDLVEEAGFKAVEADNADEALAILQSGEPIHGVFTDIDMPGSIDGVGLANVVRKQWPGIVILVASGKRRVSEVQLPDGAHYFPKPYDAKSIIRTLEDRLPD